MNMNAFQLNARSPTVGQQGNYCQLDLGITDADVQLQLLDML